jgi:hypothetical protein
MDNDGKRRQNGGFFAKGNNEGVKISRENQPSPEAKSEGWKKRNLREELIERLAEELFKVKAPEMAVRNSVIDAEEKGNVKNLIDLLKLIKMPDKFELGGSLDIKQALVEFVDGNSSSNDTDKV